MIRSKQTFSFNPPISLAEEGKWLLGVTSVECTISVFNITNENNSFSISIPGHYQTESAEKIFNDLKQLLQPKYLALHVEEVRKKGNEIKIGVNEYTLSDLDTQKNGILEELGNVKFNYLKDLVYRMQLTYDEIIDILDLKCIPTKKIGCSLNPMRYQKSDLNNALKIFHPIM